MPELKAGIELVIITKVKGIYDFRHVALCNVFEAIETAHSRRRKTSVRWLLS